MVEKVYKSLDERIEVLKQRNMNIKTHASNEKKILKENNYYNLINGYKHLFLDRVEMGKSENRHKGDIYLTGTKPSELFAVMKFDDAMRSIFLKQLLVIEENVKHAIVQAFYETFSHADLHKEFEYTKEKYYNTSSTYFVQQTNKKLFQSTTRTSIKNGIPIRSQDIYESDYRLIDRKKKHSDFCDIVTNAITEQKDKKESIKSYKNKHGYVPMWILTNILTMGNISHLFIILKEDVAFSAMDKLGISHNNQEVDIYNMYRCLGVISLYRNICAHNDRFVCTSHSYKIDDDFMNYGKALVNYKEKKYHNTKLRHNQREARKYAHGRIFPLIFSIMIFLENDERDKMIKKINKEFDKLSNKLNTIDVKKVKTDIGLNIDIQKQISFIPQSIQ